VYTRFDNQRGLFYCALTAQGDCALYAWSYPRHVGQARGARVRVDGAPLTLSAARFDALGGFLVYEASGATPPYAPVLHVASSARAPDDPEAGLDVIDYTSRAVAPPLAAPLARLEVGQLELFYTPKPDSESFKERDVWLYWVERVEEINAQGARESRWQLRAWPLPAP